MGPRGACLIDRAVESRRGRSVVGRTLRWDLEWDLRPGSHATRQVPSANLNVLYTTVSEVSYSTVSVSVGITTAARSLARNKCHILSI